MEMITLDNGMRVIFDENNSLQSANLSVWVASGSRFENESTSGISHFIEHMLFKGTVNRTAFEIAAQTDEVGGQLNAYTTKEYTCFYVKALGRHIEKAADVLFDMLTSPLFDSDDLDVERGVILEEIAMCNDDPSDVCFSLLERTLMPGSPLSREILGSQQNVSRFTPDDLRQHMKRFYVPERTVIGISGNFSRDTITGKIKEYFGAMKNTGYPAFYEPVSFVTGFSVKERQFEQSQLMFAFPAIGSENPDRFALQVLVSVLGASSSSRLNQRIREQLGLVYSIDAWLSQAVGAGFIGVSLALTPSNEKQAIEETCEVIRSFSETLKGSELSIAKEKVKSNLLMNREMPHSRLSANGYAQITRGGFTNDDEIISTINGLSLERAKILADKYLDPRALCFAACGQVRQANFYQDIVNSCFHMV